MVTVRLPRTPTVALKLEPSFFVEGAIRRVWEVDEEFVRPSHDVVLRRDGGSYCVSPIWATSLIRYLMTMWCGRPTRVGGLHHQRSLEITRFTSRKGRRLLQITLL
jgi:hypothetical protein